MKNADPTTLHDGADPTPTATVSPVAVAALSFLVGATAFAVDGSLPALPAMGEALGAAPGAAQRTVGLYLLGYALGQIPAGILADHFGRRKVLYAGMTAFVLAACLTAMAPGIGGLVATRFAQGMFGASGAVLARAIARDMTSGAETVRLMSFLTAMTGVAMVSAPAVGATMLLVFGWRATFAASALFGFLGLALAVKSLPETRKHGSLTLWSTFRGGVSTFLRSRKALFGTGLSSLIFGSLITFVTFSSDILIREVGLSEIGYALCYGIISAGFIGGGTLSRGVARRFPFRRLIGGAAVGFAVVATLALAGAAFPLPVPVLVVLLFLFLFCVGGMFALSMSLALEDLGAAAGTGAGLLGTIQLLCGAVISLALTLYGIHTVPALLTAMGIGGFCIAATACAFLAGGREAA